MGQSQKVFLIWSHPQKIEPNHFPSISERACLLLAKWRTFINISDGTNFLNRKDF